MKAKFIFFVLSVFIFISCSSNPTGIYEGEIGENSIILDFTVDNVVIVKTASIYRIRRVATEKISLYHEKTKCHWTKKKKIVSIYNEEKTRIFSFKIQGEDFIDVASGERLNHKH